MNVLGPNGVRQSSLILGGSHITPCQPAAVSLEHCTAIAAKS